MSGELLKFIVDNGIINLDTIQEQMDMRRKKEIIDQHPNKIWLGKDGFWHTYINNTDGTRKSIKKKDKNDIYKLLVDKASDTSEFLFENRFKVWIIRQEACGRSDATIKKYESDYKRFLKDDPIVKRDIRDIRDDDIGRYITRLLENNEVSYKNLKQLFGYLRGVFNKSMIDKIITDNPCKYIDLPIFKKKCTEHQPKTVAERTVSKKEKNRLLEEIAKSSSMARFAVELSLYTGMRVGELAGLKWEHVNFDSNIIRICSSEKYNPKTKEYYISETKTGKERIIPLTDDMKDVLKRTKAEEARNGYLCEFVFSNEEGRVHTNTISTYLRNHTMSEDFVNTKSIHAIRRTLNSELKCMGVSTTVAAALLGHTEKVNEEHYTYDITSLDDKRRFMELAGKIS